MYVARIKMALLGFELWQVLLTIVFAWFIIKRFMPGDKMPPSVPGIPFLGNILQVNALSISFDLTRLAEKYGDLFTISLFGQKLVAVNSEELIMELYAKSGEDFVNRPYVSYVIWKGLYGSKGVVFRPWNEDFQHIRKICTHAIMMAGEKKEQVQSLIQEEAEGLVEIFNGYEGKPIDPYDDIHVSIMNVISALTFGKRFPRDDPDCGLLKELLKYMGQVITPGFGLELDLFPFLRRFPIQSTKILNKMIEVRDEFVGKHYQELQDTFQKDSLRSFTDYMIQCKHEQDESKDRPFSDETIKAVILDMFLAGVVTTFSTLYSIVAILVNRQDIQKKLQDEIDVVIGRSQMPSLKHSADLHYVRAFLYEVLRYVTVGSAATKAAYKDSYFKGYFIPKHTTIIVNLFCAHHDPQKWKDPWTVDPGRFLDENGHQVGADHPNRKRLLAFGGGKRNCIGEVFGKNRSFLFLTYLLQRFSFLPAEGEPLPIDDPRKFTPQLIIRPPPYKIRIIRRD